MQCSPMLEIHSVLSTTPPYQQPDQYSSDTMCEDCYTECGDDRSGSCISCEVDTTDDILPELILDILYAEETITSAEDYVEFVTKWQHRREETSAPFLVLHCNLLGPGAEILRQKFSLKRNTNIQVVYSDVREGEGSSPGSGVNLDSETSPFKETWRLELRERANTVRDATAVFQGNALVGMVGTRGGLEDMITLDDLVVMYVPTIFAELYAHSLSALMNSLHTFTPFLEEGRRSSSRGGKVIQAPAPACCLENAVTHSQRARRSERDQALYDSANLVATQLYNGVASHFGPEVCRELQRRGAGIDAVRRIGLENETVPFQNLYVARSGEVQLRRGGADLDDAFEIVCWTCHGLPGGGEFVVPGLMYKFDTGQGSTVLFRPARFFHATLPAEQRDSVNEKFAVALIS